jgi:hypothetical protein
VHEARWYMPDPVGEIGLVELDQCGDVDDGVPWQPARRGWKKHVARPATGEVVLIVRLTPYRSFHSFHPLSPRCPRLERLAEVLRLADHLPTLEFHNADHVKRLPVIRQDEFADPKIAAT